MKISWIRSKIKKQEYDLSMHAHSERQNKKISISEIEKVILKGDIIEKYPKDARGESCLVAGIISQKSLHVVCGKRDKRLLLVTVYRPSLPVWIDYKNRAKELKSRE